MLWEKKDQVTVVRISEYAKKLADRLLTEAGGKHSPTVCRNRRSSVCYGPTGGTRQIVFGYEDLWTCFAGGLYDYPSIAHRLWGNDLGVRGYKAVWAVVLHEVAHTQQDVRVYGSCHNESFVQAVQELKILCPFEETGAPNVEVRVVVNPAVKQTPAWIQETMSKYGLETV